MGIGEERGARALDDRRGGEGPNDSEREIQARAMAKVRDMRGTGREYYAERYDSGFAWELA